MKLGKFAEALKVIPPERAFERAYCLYRTNKLTEAQAAAKAANPADPKFSYLLAQVVSAVLWPQSLYVIAHVLCFFLSFSFFLFFTFEQNYKMENFAESAAILEKVLSSSELVSGSRLLLADFTLSHSFLLHRRNPSGWK